MSLFLEATLDRNPGLKPLLAAVRRYGFSAAGPIMVSGANFLASLLFVHHLPAADFGLFSFVLVTSALAMSMSGCLLVMPVTRAMGMEHEGHAQLVADCLKMNPVLGAGVTGLIFAALALAGAALQTALLLGLFGGALAWRWFARCNAYIEGRTGRANACDLLYAGLLLGGLLALLLLHQVTLENGAWVLLLAAVVSTAPAGRSFFAAQWAALFTGRLLGYAAIFRNLTSWALLGVFFSEMTVNAHVYLVTLVAGPGAFAPLALGMLLMRPASLLQSALPDLERPRMTRQIAARDWRGLARTTREFRLGLFAALAGTLLLDAALLIWTPQLVMKNGYHLPSVVLVAGLCAAVMAVRCLRWPPNVQMQAAGAFKELARLGIKSGAISLLAALVLLLTFGAVASLCGVLLGEVVMMLDTRKLAAEWQARHG